MSKFLKINIMFNNQIKISVNINFNFSRNLKIFAFFMTLNKLSVINFYFFY